jgi:hypothetical protein
MKFVTAESESVLLDLGAPSSQSMATAFVQVSRHESTTTRFAWPVVQLLYLRHIHRVKSLLRM